MSATGSEKLTSVVDSERSTEAEMSPKSAATDSDTNDPTGLDDLENLIFRLEQGETFSDPSSDGYEDNRQHGSGAVQLDDYLLAVINERGHSIVNGIIVLRAADKVLGAWNTLLQDKNFEQDAYESAALRVVSATNNFDPTSVYHLTGQAFIKMLNKTECSLRGLAEIQSAVDAMRRRIENALDFERTENGKAEEIESLTRELIVLEREFQIHQEGNRVDVSVADGGELDSVPAHGKRTKGRAPDWTDDQRLEVLKVYRDYPDVRTTHQERADLFNIRFPEVQRSRNGIRQEYTRLVNQRTTIAQLEAKLNEQR